MRALSKLVLGAIAAVAVASPVMADDRWDRDGRWDRNHYDRSWNGKGWSKLDPWLRNSTEGHRWTMRNFDRNGSLDKSEARDANRAFKRLADRNRDGRLSNGEIRWGLDAISRGGWRR